MILELSPPLDSLDEFGWTGHCDLISSTAVSALARLAQFKVILSFHVSPQPVSGLWWMKFSCFYSIHLSQFSYFHNQHKYQIALATEKQHRDKHIEEQKLKNKENILVYYPEL